MKIFVKRAMKDEKGAALALALVLLVVGGLILTPLLGLMSTGLMAGQVYEKKTQELYAADAGVEDAVWRLQTNNLTFDANNSSGPWNLAVNGKNVTVVVYRQDLDPTCAENLTYEILSAAATNDRGSTAAIDSITTIDTYLVVSYLNFAPLLDYAIVSNTTINIQPHVTVNGSVWLPYEEGLSVGSGSNITGDTVTLSDGVSVTWPKFDQLSTYYLARVAGADDPGEDYNINGQTRNEGPWYRRGSLDIDNEHTTNQGTLILDGTVYVDGNLYFRQAGSHNYTIELRGQTIFVGGDIDFASNAITISGSGCIIARGDINFQPSISSSKDDFVLVMSMEGTVTMQPSGDLTGCVVGNLEAYVSPDDPKDAFGVNWIPLGEQELDFPMGVDLDNLPPVTGTRIESWEINPQ